MKKSWFTLMVLACLVSCGCQALSRAWGPMGDDGKPPNQWDGSGYKRSVGVGTGIDPQAREIEKRLGYSSERF